MVERKKGKKKMRKKAHFSCVLSNKVVILTTFNALLCTKQSSIT